MTKKNTFRIVACGSDGELQMRDYPAIDPLVEHYVQIGGDDCSTDLELRGLPVFRGLIGPMAEGKTIVRYETPEVFESLTKEWGANTTKPRRTRTRKPDRATPTLVSKTTPDVPIWT